MRALLCQTVRLPASEIEVEVGVITMRQSLQADHDANATERPAYITEETWSHLHRLAVRVRRFGQQPGVTVDQLLELPEAEFNLLIDGVKEVQEQAASFRRAAPASDVGPGAGGEGDGLEPREPAGAP